MNTEPTEIPDVLVIEPQVFGDERGSFFESWNARTFADRGLDVSFVQDNHSHSRRNTIRGLHYQINRPQGKLVRVTAGRVWDVVVDLRRNSESFGRWVGVWLDAEAPSMVWVPPGFAHGFYVASETADFVYKCTDYYVLEEERTIRWDDPTLAIDWPFAAGTAPLVSARDNAGVAFDDAEVFA
ncbi:MAG: dTDP-4-dehydrorhamnose 3,5-epimerase [Acidobacteriota bacterium]|nr:dTDP-4-dehydrorhamnose 3,5-epimerase [Acidobacteriota bacterium]